ncbi:MAG: hypothetical protein AB4426_04140 [Xenococcaceae cyanobacterium]
MAKEDNKLKELKELEELCGKLENILNLNINKLFEEVTERKNRLINPNKPVALTFKEKRYLCLSLLGNEPKDIGRQDICAPKDIRTSLSKTINRYIKDLLYDLLKEEKDEIYLGWFGQLISDVGGSADKSPPLPSWFKIYIYLLSSGYSTRKEELETVEIKISDKNLKGEKVVFNVKNKGELLVKIFEFLQGNI